MSHQVPQLDIILNVLPLLECIFSRNAELLCTAEICHSMTHESPGPDRPDCVPKQEGRTSCSHALHSRRHGTAAPAHHGQQPEPSRAPEPSSPSPPLQQQGGDRRHLPFPMPLPRRVSSPWERVSPLLPQQPQPHLPHLTSRSGRSRLSRPRVPPRSPTASRLLYVQQST